MAGPGRNVGAGSGVRPLAEPGPLVCRGEELTKLETGNSATRPADKRRARRGLARRDVAATLDGVSLFDIVPTVTDLLRESVLPLRAIWPNTDVTNYRGATGLDRAGSDGPIGRSDVPTDPGGGPGADRAAGRVGRVTPAKRERDGP